MLLIDVQAGFGGFTPGRPVQASAESLVEELRRLGIARALARITPAEQDFDIPHSNDLLYAACAAHPELIPCPAAAPDAVGDLGGDARQVADAIAHGAAAVALRPGPDHWLAEPWACRTLLEALADRAMPAYAEASLLDYGAIARLAAAFPRNRFIYAGVDYRSLRILLPLMLAHPNISLSIGNNFNFHEGLRLFAERVGADRLLFGTGLLGSEAGAAIGMLAYSGLPETQIADIASGNFLRLQEGIRK